MKKIGILGASGTIGYLVCKLLQERYEIIGGCRKNNENFKKIVSAKKISLYRVSKLSGVQRNVLGRILNGLTPDPRISTVKKIAKALELDEHEFADLCGYKNDR